MARRNQPRPELPTFQVATKPTVSMTEHIFETLKESILNQHLPSGTPLIESHLATEFKVSKTPVREALQKLAQTGLVDMAHIRGASVHALQAREAQDIFEMRALLEPQALLLGAKNFSKKDFINLNDILRQATLAIQNKNNNRLSALNTEFHRGLYSQCQNQILLSTLDGLADRRRLLSLRGWLKNNQSLAELKEHREILKSLVAGKTKLAATQLREHIQKFSQLLLKG